MAIEWHQELIPGLENRRDIDEQSGQREIPGTSVSHWERRATSTAERISRLWKKLKERARRGATA